MNGAPWNNHQWGYEILVALLHRGLGWGGFRVAIPLLVGSVVLGGLLISTLFTLILVPTLFTLTMDFKSAVIRYWRGDNGTSSGDGSVRTAVGESQASSASVDNSPTVAPRSSLQS